MRHKDQPRKREALARLVGWSMTLKELAPRMRCSKCGKKVAEVVVVARPPGSRGVPKNPHRRQKRKCCAKATLPNPRTECDAPANAATLTSD